MNLTRSTNLRILSCANKGVADDLGPLNVNEPHGHVLKSNNSVSNSIIT